MPSTPAPPVCHQITQHHPSLTSQPLNPVSFALKDTTDGVDPGYLRGEDPLLIALSHNTASQLHDSADIVTPVHRGGGD